MLNARDTPESGLLPATSGEGAQLPKRQQNEAAPATCRLAPGCFVLATRLGFRDVPSSRRLISRAYTRCQATVGSTPRVVVPSFAAIRKHQRITGFESLVRYSVSPVFIRLRHRSALPDVRSDILS